MATTNSTANYELSQYTNNDVTSYLTNYNSDMLKIDTQMKANADAASAAASDASSAVSTANTAASTATTAATNAATALSTANTANAAATAAETAAGAAQTAAASALTAAAGNTITNLAPAYDPTATYDVGDLVTFIDDQDSGKLYKCIVAVTSPMAFDINYWDDVTTSEIYSYKQTAHEVYETVAGTSTYQDVYSAIFNYIKNHRTDKNISNLHVYYMIDGDDVSKYNIARLSALTNTYASISNIVVFYPSLHVDGYRMNYDENVVKYSGCIIDDLNTANPTISGDTDMTGTISQHRHYYVEY